MRRSRPGDVTGHPVGLPGAAERDVGAGPAVQRVLVQARLDVVYPGLGVVGGVVERSGRRRSMATAARWNAGLRGAKGRGRSIVGDPPDRPREVVGREADRRALLREREHAVTRPAALLLEHHRPAAAPRRHHDVARAQRVEAAVLRGVHRTAGIVPGREQGPVLLDVAFGVA